MSVGKLFGKRTWLCLVLTAVILLFWIMVGALLIIKAVLPLESAGWWITVGCVLAIVFSGCIAGKGSGLPALPLVVAALLYLMLWLAALSTSQPVDFRPHGAQITAAVFGGGFLSCLLYRGGRRKKRGKRRRK